MKALKVEEHVVYYEGKEIQEYNEVRVLFKDGSLANVESGEINNIGGGTIEIKPLSEIVYEQLSLSNVFNAKKIQVTELPGNLVVESHDQSYIEMKIEGPRGIVGNIKTRKWQDNILQISYFAGNDWLNGIGLSLKDIFNPPNPLFKYPNEKLYTSVYVTLKVPIDTELSVLNPLGSVQIGIVHGKISLKCNNKHSARMDSVKDIAVELSENASLEIDYIYGEASFILYGSSYVSINSGEITHLSLVSHSKTDVSINADIKKGFVKPTNSGVIFLNKEPMKKIPT